MVIDDLENTSERHDRRLIRQLATLHPHTGNTEVNIGVYYSSTTVCVKSIISKLQIINLKHKGLGIILIMQHSLTLRLSIYKMSSCHTLTSTFNQITNTIPIKIILYKLIVYLYNSHVKTTKN